MRKKKKISFEWLPLSQSKRDCVTWWEREIARKSFVERRIEKHVRKNVCVWERERDAEIGRQRDWVREWESENVTSSFHFEAPHTHFTFARCRGVSVMDELSSSPSSSSPSLSSSSLSPSSPLSTDPSSRVARIHLRKTEKEAQKTGRHLCTPICRTCCLAWLALKKHLHIILILHVLPIAARIGIQVKLQVHWA